MNICFNTCWFSFDVVGGGEFQFLNTRKAVEAQGIHTRLFNQWKPEFDQFDLVHFFTVQQGMASFCEYVKNRGLPLALSPIFWPRPDASRGEMWETEKMFRLADVIFPNSEAEVEIIRKTFDIPAEKFRVTVNAIDPSEFAPAQPAAFRHRYQLEGKPFILCVGNIEPRKNQLRTLEALKKARIDWPLVTIGHVRDKNYFAQCESGFSNFIYLGPSPQSELSSAYAACDLFVLPGTCETPGLAALEAGYFGAPLLVTEVGCTREYFGEHAVYVNPYDVESIARGFSESLSRPLERSELLKKRVLENFTWRQTAEQVIAGYKSILPPEVL